MHTRFTHSTHVAVHTWLWIMAHTTPSSCSLHLGTATLLRHTSRADTAAWRDIVDSRNWNATYNKQRTGRRQHATQGGHVMYSGSIAYMNRTVIEA